MRRLFTVAFASVVAIGGLLPLAATAGDAEAGKAKAAICAACHGVNGIAVIPGYPNLAGQNEQYLISTLKAYRSQERTGGLAAVMYAQAANLSDEDIENLAAYFHQMTGE